MALLTAAALATAVSLTSVPAPAAAPTYAKIGDGSVAFPTQQSTLSEWTLYYAQNCEGVDIWDANVTAVVNLAPYIGKVIEIRLGDWGAGVGGPDLRFTASDGCGDGYTGVHQAFGSQPLDGNGRFSFKVVDARYLVVYLLGGATNVHFSVHRCTTVPQSACPITAF